MSGNIPLEIEIEMMKMLPVKSLIRLRSVCKAWKSLIDSSDFIAHYSGQQQHLLVRYEELVDFKPKYVSIVDDDTFPQHKVTLTSPLLVNKLKKFDVVGCSKGLLCFYAGHDSAVILNPSIRKAVDVVVPHAAYGFEFAQVLSFGVCPVTNDPKIVKIKQINRWSDMERISSIPWHVEVFTLSTRAWRSPYRNLPRKSLQFDYLYAAMDGFLYWHAIDTSTLNAEYTNLIVSFDLTSEEFGEIELPCCLARQTVSKLSIFNLRESLVVINHCVTESDQCVRIWMMEDGVSKSFTNLYTVRPEDAYVLFLVGFRKSGEPILEVKEDHGTSIVVCEPQSNHIDKLGIDIGFSFSVYPYMETLLLLDQPDMTFNDDMEN